MTLASPSNVPAPLALVQGAAAKELPAGPKILPGSWAEQGANAFAANRYIAALTLLIALKGRSLQCSFIVDNVVGVPSWASLLQPFLCVALTVAQQR